MGANAEDPVPVLKAAKVAVTSEGTEKVEGGGPFLTVSSEGTVLVKVMLQFQVRRRRRVKEPRRFEVKDQPLAHMQF